MTGEKASVGSPWIQVIGPVLLALFVNAGQLKESLFFGWLPVDLTVLTAALVFASMIVSQLTVAPAHRTVIIPLALWAAFIPAALFADFDLPYANTKVLTLFTLSLLLALAPFVLLRTPLQRRAFVLALIAIGLAVALIALFFDRATAADYSDRLVFRGINTISTARVALAAALVALVLAATRGSRLVVRTSLVFVTAMCGLLAVLTGSRGPLIAAATAVVAVAATARVYAEHRGRSTLILVGGFALGIWYLFSQESEGANRILELLGGDADASAMARIGIWDAALAAIVENPFGNGWGAFATLSGGIYTYPHNIILEVAMEAGIPVAGLLTGFLVVTFVRSVRQSTNAEGATLLGLLVFATLSAMFSSDLNGARLLFVVAFAAWAMPAATRQRGAPPGMRELRLGESGSSLTYTDHSDRVLVAGRAEQGPGFGVDLGWDDEGLVADSGGGGAQRLLGTSPAPDRDAAPRTGRLTGL